MCVSFAYCFLCVHAYPPPCVFVVNWMLTFTLSFVDQLHLVHTERKIPFINMILVPFSAPGARVAMPFAGDSLIETIQKQLDFKWEVNHSPTCVLEAFALVVFFLS